MNMKRIHEKRMLLLRSTTRVDCFPGDLHYLITIDTPYANPIGFYKKNFRDQIVQKVLKAACFKNSIIL